MAWKKSRARRRAGRPTLVCAVVASLSVMAAGCAGFGGGGGGEVSAEVSDTQKALYQDAVDAGGELSVFVGTSSNTELDQLVELFNEEFPGINVSYVSGTGDEVSERVLTEKRSGLSNADVLLLAGMSAFERINDEGYIEKFTPEDVELFTQDKSAYIPDAVYSFSDLVSGACYNPDNVSEEEAALLKTYEGWTDPTWKGRAAVVNVDGFGYRFAMTEWVYGDKSLGKPWLEDLAALDPTVYNSGNVAVPQTIAGEYDVVYNVITSYGARAHAGGEPLECVTAEYAPFYTFGSALVTEAPNSAAGKVFLNWLYSESGQSAIQETLAWTARREGFDTPVSDAPWWQDSKDPRFVEEDVVEKNYDDLFQTFNDVMGAAEEK